ncbi:hypothetical protein [Kineococcus rhizosphaerae]|uniref:hypothetical protein n=1 Tax=Kineococcus rhizosphaerae TaxID=559628 RepID=UPI000D05AD30|nr:hypothetical protein [Kineococcus rhizosphaerae]
MTGPLPSLVATALLCSVGAVGGSSALVGLSACLCGVLAGSAVGRARVVLRVAGVVLSVGTLSVSLTGLVLGTGPGWAAQSPLTALVLPSLAALLALHASERSAVGPGRPGTTVVLAWAATVGALVAFGVGSWWWVDGLCGGAVAVVALRPGPRPASNDLPPSSPWG